MDATQSFDPQTFRRALGNFATGVTVITAKGCEEGFVGVTISSFNSVSIDPPMILWSQDKHARSLSTYQRAEHFVVNVLAADQIGLSNHFARQQEDKFKDVNYTLNAQGIPVLAGSAAHFECKTVYQYEAGDHIIFVGEVNRLDVSDRDSLLFYQGGYALSTDHPGKPHTTPKDLEDGCCG